MPKTSPPRPGNSGSESKPQVSVIIPAYNTAAYIAETLDSVFAQTFKDFEVIVINDGSPDTDGLEKVLEPYRKGIVYVQQENRGVSGARNAGIRHACGEFLAFLDSDDLWLPGYLAAQTKFLQAHPRVVASIADWLEFGMPRGDEVTRKQKDNAANIRTFEQMLKRQGGQIPSATVVRRMRALEVGMFDEDFSHAEDLEFVARISFPDGAIGYLGQVLVKYRQRQESATGGSQNRKWHVAEIKALRRLGEKLALTDAQRALLAQEISAGEAALALTDAYNFLAAQQIEQGVRSLRQANTYYHDARITVALVGLKAFPRWTARLLSRRQRSGKRN